MKTKSNSVRIQLTSWINSLNSESNLDLFIYIPLFLEGLFLMKGD